MSGCVPQVGGAEDRPSQSQWLTFGLEIEMILPRPPAGQVHLGSPQYRGFIDPHPDDPRWYSTKLSSDDAQNSCEEAVKYCLGAAGIANAVLDLAFDPDEGMMESEVQVSRIWFPRLVHRYRYWRIMPDTTCEPEKWFSDDELLGRYEWSPVELASNVFTTSVPSDTWLSMTQAQELQVTRICQELTKNLRIRISQSCGLHCHLGIGDGKIPDDTIRRFITVIWLIEPAVLLLCPPWRPRGYYSMPISTRSRLVKDESFLRRYPAQNDTPAACDMLMDDALQQSLPLLVVQQVRLIWWLPLDELDRALSSHEGSTRGTVSIAGCCNRPAVPHTIEIRYGSSTLIPREIASWTNIFIRLFQLCHYYEAYTVRVRLLLHGVVDAIATHRHAGHELLRILDLSADIPVWTAAEQRWARESDHDYIRKYPFVDRQA